MKNYATESDIIETADPLFYPGDKVQARTHDTICTYVRDFAWDTLNKTWTYCVVYFQMPGHDPKWTGSVANEAVPEKDLKLISRPQRNNRASENKKRSCINNT